MAFVVRKGSPFHTIFSIKWGAFNKHTHTDTRCTTMEFNFDFFPHCRGYWIRETGIFAKHFKYWVKNMPLCGLSSLFKSVGLQYMAPILTSLVSAYLFTLFMLICEIVYCHWTKKRAHTNATIGHKSNRFTFKPNKQQNYYVANAIRHMQLRRHFQWEQFSSLLGSGQLKPQYAKI